ncbi:MAG: 3-deoxy-D-manno-octulosonic acid transferase [Flavisolibacter sp.]
MLLLYNITIRLYFLVVRIAAMWNKKALEWIQGRQDWANELQKEISPGDRVIWMHCSSAGEFEQGKPLIEQLKIFYPVHKILVSFFSPSGFDTAKAYPYADFITYLPLDTAKNAKTFMELVHPDLVIFVKYEFWYHHLAETAFKHIPTLLVSAVFRKDQVFFKRYGLFYRQMLFFFRHIFAQDLSSLKLLQEQGISHCSLGGDTRFDRVKEIADSLTELPLIREFKGQDPLVVAGSTWPEDEQLLSHGNFHKLILAPHEINEGHLAQLEGRFKGAIRYSQLSVAKGSEKVLIIDNVGMLSRIYQYATLAYIGGGFSRDGIHNILEAAVYGKPVIFGPNYGKYREARELIGAGGAFSVKDAEQFTKLAEKLLQDRDQRDLAALRAKKYVESNTGSTQKIIQFIQEKRLLTR